MNSRFALILSLRVGCQTLLSHVNSMGRSARLLLTLSTRLLVYAALTPLLQHIGYGMSWQHCMACVWGGLRGPLSLCLTLIVLQTPATAEVGEVSPATVFT